MSFFRFFNKTISTSGKEHYSTALRQSSNHSSREKKFWQLVPLHAHVWTSSFSVPLPVCLRRLWSRSVRRVRGVELQCAGDETCCPSRAHSSYCVWTARRYCHHHRHHRLRHLSCSVNSFTSAHRGGGALPMFNVSQLSLCFFVLFRGCVSCLTCTSGAAFTPRLLSMVSVSLSLSSLAQDPLMDCSSNGERCL